MHDDQFTATGPPVAGSGFLGAGFSTVADTTAFAFGVQVKAARIGVVGQTGGGIAGVGVSVTNTNQLFNLNVAPGSFDLESLGGGRGTGVLGKSGRGFGVHGISKTNTAVVGEAEQGFGIHGISKTNTAVVGSSTTGFGVHGMSGGDGVVGDGGAGTGVTGRSDTGRGGRFESGRGGPIVGQVQLVPQRMPVTELVPASPSVYDADVAELLPRDGQGGDLLVTVGDDGDCVLWFCSRSATPTDPATWRQALLGDPRPAPAAHVRTFVDWREVAGNRATGTLFGHEVILEGPIGAGSAVDASFRGYDTPAFHPQLPLSDCIEIVGRAGHTFTLTFAAPVHDPVLMLASLGSIITFPAGTEVTRVSGDEGFVVAGTTVSGEISASQDSNGVAQLTGTFTTITFSAVTNVPSPGVVDGIYLQIGGSAPT